MIDRCHCERLFVTGENLSVKLKDKDVCLVEVEVLEAILNDSNIEIPEEKNFFINIEGMKANERIYISRELRSLESLMDNQDFVSLKNEEDIMLYNANFDFSHTTPNWVNVLKYGIAGMIEYNKNALKKINVSNLAKQNYECRARLLSFCAQYMSKVADEAEKVGKIDMANGLKNLCVRPPQNLFEALQMIIIWYELQHNLECSYIRCFGRLDEVLFPFYKKELENGTSKQQIEDLICLFYKELESKKIIANVPFMLGGLDADGNSLVNDLSYILFEQFIKLQSPDLKVHFLYDEKIPERFFNMALNAIINGSNSIVFMNEKVVKHSLSILNFDKEDIDRYSVIGCYEPAAFGEVECSCAGGLNLPKVLEVLLNDGQDIKYSKQVYAPKNLNYTDFNSFYLEFLKLVRYFCKRQMHLLNIKESLFPRVHAGHIFSSSLDNCMENGKDVYANFGAKYNNTSIVALGTATICDSLMAIKKLVFEDKIVSIKELVNILKNNWVGFEDLRFKVQNDYPKFGNNNDEVDMFIKDIVDVMAEEVNNKPNAKGGVYRLACWSVNWRFDFGAKTGATADGRLDAEPLSKNCATNVGMNKEGVTAHALSVAKINHSKLPDGSVLDIVVHSSAVKGDEGFNALKSLVKTYLDLGGFAVHVNVLDTQILRDAQKNPALYPNLQVRLCGWNVLFSSLSEKEQTEFIIQSEM